MLDNNKLTVAEHSFSAINPAYVLADITDKVNRGANIVEPVDRTVPFRHWKAGIQNKLSSGEISYANLNVSEQFALRIANVTESSNKLSVRYENGGGIDLYFNGSYEKIDKNNRRRGLTETNSNTKRVKINFDVREKTGYLAGMLLERAMLIAWSIYTDKFPLNLNNLEANVMDASGNFQTARKLGIKPNFHPSNIEWALGSRNSAHDDTVIKIKNKIGNVYRLSANDVVAEDLARTEDNIEVINYYLDLIGAVRVK